MGNGYPQRVIHGNTDHVSLDPGDPWVVVDSLDYWLWRKTANTKKFAILSAFEWPEKWQELLEIGENITECTSIRRA